MKNILKYIFLASFFIFLNSCSTADKESITYFGGKIINPKADYVLLLDQDELIDSLFLDKDDKFVGKYKDFKEGFYIFRHGNEYQHVYIESKDSILVRLNTWNFDETLVFSGHGADKNNILIDWFLESEKEEKEVSNYFKLPSNIFKFKMDSLLNLRQQKIDVFKSKNENLPDSYLNVLNIIVNYPVYTRFEQYLSYNKHYNKAKEYPKTDKDFYLFRKNTNINIDSLKYLGQYSNYITYRLYNIVNSKGFSSKSNKYTKVLLNTIDENITDEKLKNSLFHQSLVKDFLNKSSCNLDKELFHSYFKLSTNIDDKKQVQRIINDIENLHGSDILPEFEITDYLKTKRSVKKFTKNKNSVIHFWSPKYIYKTDLIDRVNYLTKSFPEINFILVKIKDIDSDHVKGLDIKNQFYIDTSSKANLFLTSKLPRTLLINKKGMVVNGYANMRSRLFNKQLEEFQKN